MSKWLSKFHWYLLQCFRLYFWVDYVGPSLFLLVTLTSLCSSSQNELWFIDSSYMFFSFELITVLIFMISLYLLILDLLYMRFDCCLNAVTSSFPLRTMCHLVLCWHLVLSGHKLESLNRRGLHLRKCFIRSGYRQVWRVFS